MARRIRSFISIALIFSLVFATTACAHTSDVGEGNLSGFGNLWCHTAGGTTGYRFSDGDRIDCLTDQHAIVFEPAREWARALGEAQYYSARTGRHPGVVLIVDHETEDFPYLKKILTAVQDDAKHWRVWIIKRDSGY